MSDHSTSGTLFQELVPFALALKLMLHELSMSLTAEAHVKDSCINLRTPIEAIFLSRALTQKQTIVLATHVEWVQRTRQAGCEVTLLHDINTAQLTLTP